MKIQSFSAKVTRLDGGTMVVEPYHKTGSKRYDYMLQTECTQLRRTKKDYIVVFRSPRERGIIAATRLLISECARISVLMYNEYFHHHAK